MSLILIISGPAGSGKTTLCEKLIAQHPHLKRFVTTTTRDPRPNERAGVDYHFMTKEDFEAAIEKGDFIEWARVHGRLYGSQKSRLLEAIKQGHDLIFNIDVQGAESLKSALLDLPQSPKLIRSIFILPVSPEQIRQRLIQRGTDDEKEIAKRLNSAQMEITHANRFDFQIISGTREEDFQKLNAYYNNLHEEAGLTEQHL